MTVLELIRKLVNCDMGKEVVIDVRLQSGAWPERPGIDVRSVEVLSVAGWHEHVTIEGREREIT